MLLTLGFHNYLLSPQANWLNALFTFTRLNLYLDLFPVIWTFIALVKAFNERKHKKTFFLCYYDCLETLHENNTLPLYMVQPTDLRYSRYSTPMDSTVQYSTVHQGKVQYSTVHQCTVQYSTPLNMIIPTRPSNYKFNLQYSWLCFKNVDSYENLKIAAALPICQICWAQTSLSYI